MLLLAPLLWSATADAATWELDPAHSRVGFAVTHLMVSTVEGQFTEPKATLDYEVGDLKGLKVTVTVDMKSVDTRNDQRDEHLRTSDFLDVEKYPTMTFESRSVEVAKKGGFLIHGDLTLRGVTRPVTLTASGLTQSVKDPWGNERVGAKATATIDRQEFGVAWNQALEAGGMLVSDEVELQIDAEFIRK
ncbi:MAG: YceI family protein [Alphaproteobacteria bacterium]|nr:YceI family protein [Alphaproteobacteria bacterium]